MIRLAGSIPLFVRCSSQSAFQFRRIRHATRYGRSLYHHAQLDAWYNKLACKSNISLFMLQWTSDEPYSDSQSPLIVPAGRSSIRQLSECCYQFKPLTILVSDGIGECSRFLSSRIFRLHFCTQCRLVCLLVMLLDALPDTVSASFTSEGHLH